MTVKLIRFIMLVALPMCVLAGPAVDLMAGPATPAEVASTGLRPFYGKTAAQAQTPEPQSAQDPNIKKRKLVHEYGPEDLLPQAQETETSRPKRGPVAPPPGFIRPRPAPHAAVGVPAPVPAATPVLTATPAAGTTPTLIATPTPQAIIPQAITPAVTAPAVPTPAATQKSTASVSNRSTLIVASGLFLVALLALLYFVHRFIREMRTETENTVPETPAADPIRLRVDAQPAVVESIKRGEKPAKNMKNKMRKARYN